MNLVAIAFRNVGRNKRRTVLSASAIAIASIVIVFMFALVEGLKVDMMSNIIHMVSGQVRVRNAQYDANEMMNPLHFAITDAAGALAVLDTQPEVQSLSPRIRFYTQLFREGKTYKGTCMVVDFKREEEFQSLSRNLIQGRMPAMGARETAVSVGLAADMGVGVGDKFTPFTIKSNGAPNSMTFTITGILKFNVASFNKGYFFIPLDTGQRLLGMQGSVTEILVILKHGQDADKAAGALSAAMQADGRSGLSVKPWTSISVWYSYLRMAESIFTIFALIFVLLGTTVVINTTMMVIYERVREIGTMSALGMQGGSIVRLFFLESAIIGVLGALAGTIIGIAITLPMSITGIDYSEIMKSVDIEMSSIFIPVLNWKSTILSFVYTIAVTSLVSIIPSRRASRVEPVKALRAI
jgi:putative ABC transport system permease protein